MKGKNVSLESSHPIHDAYRQDDSDGHYRVKVRLDCTKSFILLPLHLSVSCFVHPLTSVTWSPGGLRMTLSTGLTNSTLFPASFYYYFIFN